MEQHLTAQRWEGFGTAPDSKEMGREMGYGRGGYQTYVFVYIHRYIIYIQILRDYDRPKHVPTSC